MAKTFFLGLLLLLPCASPTAVLSPACSASVATIAVSSGCGVLSTVLSSPPTFSNCTDAQRCTLALPDLIASIERGDRTLPEAACPLCDAPAPCRAALLAAGKADACAGTDASVLAVLRDQSAVVCARSGPSRAAGAVSSATLPQCVLCGVLPCAPGVVCTADTLPYPCPAGSSCADGVASSCRAGTFCPAGDATAPHPCRPTAAGSCKEGSSREVVWVPLLIAIVVTVSVAAVIALLERTRAAEEAALVAGAATATVISSDKEQAANTNVAKVRPPPLHVSFQDLTLTTRSVVRLDSVSGALAPGALTAIMGGSGAGKTTLLNVLLGKEIATGGVVAASEGAHSTPFSPQELRACLGFVPQTDVLLPELTAREAVMHAATARLPASIYGAELDACVNASLRALSLTARAKTLAPALSASERKRTCIAAELAAAPRLLVLDEPTTGLDANGALSVIEAVHHAAGSLALTVACVLHQPRPEIWSCVDELILLARGGRTVFVGPRSLTAAYLIEVLGYAPHPPDTAEADWIMDVVNGMHGLPRGGKVCDSISGGGSAAAVTSAAASDEDEGSVSAADALAVAVAVAALWRSDGEAWVRARRVSKEALAVEAATTPASLPTPPRAWAAQALLAASRALRQRLRQRATVGTLCSNLLGGAVAGLVLSGGPLFSAPPALQYALSCPADGRGYCTDPGSIVYQPAPFYVMMIVGSLAVPPAVLSFGRERLHAWREAGVGVPRSPYFLGRFAVDAVFWVLAALCFTGPLLAIAPLRGSEGAFFVLHYTVIAVCSAIAYALAAVTGEDTDRATLIGVVGAVVLNLFGGFVPMVGTHGVWAYTHWAQRAFVAIELVDGYGVDTRTFDSLTPTEWRKPYWQRDVGILGAFAGATVALSLVLTMVLHKDKQR